jgi:rubrerythrin
MPVQDPNKPPQDGSYRSDQGSAAVPPKALNGNGRTSGILALAVAPCGVCGYPSAVEGVCPVCHDAG